MIMKLWGKKNHNNEFINMHQYIKINHYLTKTPISFWCRRGLNPRSLIQPLETLPVKLTAHIIFSF